MELLCCKENLVQEQQPFSALTGLQNPLKEDLAVFALNTQFPACEKKGCSLAMLGGKSWLPFSQLLGNATSSFYLPSFTKHHWVAIVTFSTAKHCDASLQSSLPLHFQKYSYLFIKDFMDRRWPIFRLLVKTNVSCWVFFVISDSSSLEITLYSRERCIVPTHQSIVIQDTVSIFPLES